MNDPDLDPRLTSSPTQQRVLGLFAIAAAASIVLQSLPVVSGLFLGTILAFSLQHSQQRLSARIKPGLAALCSGLATVGGLLLLGLIATGHTAAGIFELVWGALIVVGASDYIIRPRLVRGDGKIPALITFIALFGGVEVFGLLGLIDEAFSAHSRLSFRTVSTRLPARFATFCPTRFTTFVDHAQGDLRTSVCDE